MMYQLVHERLIGATSWGSTKWKDHFRTVTKSLSETPNLAPRERYLPVLPSYGVRTSVQWSLKTTASRGAIPRGSTILHSRDKPDDADEAHNLGVPPYDR